MSDLIERLRAGAMATRDPDASSLLMDAIDRIVAMNSEHDAMCTQREAMVTKARELVLIHDGIHDRETEGMLTVAVADLAATLPPEDVVPEPAPPVLVQTSAP